MPSVPTASVTMPQAAAAAPVAHHPSALDPGAHPGGHGMRTDSPAVATSANAAVAPSPGQYHHTYQPLYTPYAAHTNSTPFTNSIPFTNSTPYTTKTVTTTVPPAVVSAGAIAPPIQPAVVSGSLGLGEREKQLRPSSPSSARVHSPSRENRERESYSNVSSLSRSSVSSLSRSSVSASTPHTLAPPTTIVSSSLSNSLSGKQPWPPAAATTTVPQPTPPASTLSTSSTLSPAPPRPTPPLHSASYPATAASGPMFAAPMAPPPVSTASPITAAATANPNPFSAENLFQTNQADMLRRELDNRFLASQDRNLGVAPPPYLRTEMHQHQHHHTHVHQHTTSLLPPPPASSLYPSQLSMSPMERLARRTQSSFKDIPKLGSVDSPFYRQNMGMPNYPGYNPGMIGHPGLTTGPTPFVPPNHLPTFQQKKTGKWNAMHVRVAWEIYHHQQKSGEAKGSIAVTKAASDLLRPPTHLFSPSVHSTRPPHEMPFPPTLSNHRPPGFDQPHHPGSLFTAPPGHLGKSPFSGTSSISPFTRYGAGPLGASATSPFSVSPFAASRESHLGLGPLHHDPWRTLQRTMPGYPPSVNTLPPTLPGLPPGPAPWTIKPDPVLEQREREAREREERERERLRREREERERREREEKQRRLEQQQQQERERERREKERREMERREMEKREREREMLLHQQRLAESAKQQLPPPVIRDRSPLRNGQADISEIRVKEEPRIKEEDMLSRTDPRYVLDRMNRYHPFLRHPGNMQPHPSMLDRSRMLQHTLPPHYPTAGSHWPPPTDPFYRYSYNPLVDAMRAQEERDRANFFGAYGHPAHHPSQLRPKDPSLLHLRGGPGPPVAHKMSATPPTDMHKKEEPR